MRKKRSQQIDLLTDFILHIFMIFFNLSFELCFVLRSICIFVQLSNQIIETMLILHLGNDIFHRMLLSFHLHWTTQFKYNVFIIKIIYAHQFTCFYWVHPCGHGTLKIFKFSWYFHAPPDPVQCQRMKNVVPAFKNAYFRHAHHVWRWLGSGGSS